MRLTITDVARRAGVSKATVSRVLNGKPDVDPQTAAAIRAIIEEVGYTRRSTALRLARGGSRCVGLLVPTLTWPWMLEVVRGVAERIESSGHSLVLHTVTKPLNTVGELAAIVENNGADGLVLIEPPGTLEIFEKFYRRGMPVVMIDDHRSQPDLPSVATTNEQGGYDAVRHLIDEGRRRIAMISGPMAFGCSVERVAGYRRALASAVNSSDPVIIESEFTTEDGAHAARSLLADHPLVDAIFACNDQAAFGVMRVLREAGRRVPDDVAVVGFDDIPAAAHTEPTLTTVRQPMYEMGAAAVQLLLEILGGAPPPGSPVVLPTELVVRDSSLAVGAVGGSAAGAGSGAAPAP